MLHVVLHPHADNGAQAAGQLQFVGDIQRRIVDAALVLVRVGVVVSRLVINGIGLIGEQVFRGQHHVGIWIWPVLVAKELDVKKQNFVVAVLVSIGRTKFQLGRAAHGFVGMRQIQANRQVVLPQGAPYTGGISTCT